MSGLNYAAFHISKIKTELRGDRYFIQELASERLASEELDQHEGCNWRGKRVKRAGFKKAAWFEKFADLFRKKENKLTMRVTFFKKSIRVNKESFQGFQKRISGTEAYKTVIAKAQSVVDKALSNMKTIAGKIDELDARISTALSPASSLSEPLSLDVLYSARKELHSQLKAISTSLSQLSEQERSVYDRSHRISRHPDTPYKKPTQALLKRHVNILSERLQGAKLHQEIESLQRRIDLKSLEPASEQRDQALAYLNNSLDSAKSKITTPYMEPISIEVLEKALALQDSLYFKKTSSPFFAHPRAPLGSSISPSVNLHLPIPQKRSPINQAIEQLERHEEVKLSGLEDGSDLQIHTITWNAFLKRDQIEFNLNKAQHMLQEKEKKRTILDAQIRFVTSPTKASKVSLNALDREIQELKTSISDLEQKLQLHDEQQRKALHQNPAILASKEATLSTQKRELLSNVSYAEDGSAILTEEEELSLRGFEDYRYLSQDPEQLQLEVDQSIALIAQERDLASEKISLLEKIMGSHSTPKKADQDRLSVVKRLLDQIQDTKRHLKPILRIIDKRKEILEDPKRAAVVDKIVADLDQNFNYLLDRREFTARFQRQLLDLQAQEKKTEEFSPDIKDEGIFDFDGISTKFQMLKALDTYKKERDEAYNAGDEKTAIAAHIEAVRIAHEFFPPKPKVEASNDPFDFDALTKKFNALLNKGTPPSDKLPLPARKFNYDYTFPYPLSDEMASYALGVRPKRAVSFNDSAYGDSISAVSETDSVLGTDLT